MKKISLPKIITQLTLHEKDFRGVFLTKDLYNLIGSDNPVVNQRTIEGLIREDILYRAKRGIYTTKNFDLFHLASIMVPSGYISMHSILAARGLMGTVPQNHICVVSPNRSTVYNFRQYTVQIFQINEDLFFGYKENSYKEKIATNEKAFLDLLYYYNLGEKFIFDPKSEIDISMLNTDKIMLYLQKYKNPKFKKFVQGIING